MLLQRNLHFAFAVDVVDALDAKGKSGQRKEEKLVYVLKAMVPMARLVRADAHERDHVNVWVQVGIHVEVVALVVLHLPLFAAPHEDVVQPTIHLWYRSVARFVRDKPQFGLAQPRQQHDGKVVAGDSIVVGSDHQSQVRHGIDCIVELLPKVNLLPQHGACADCDPTIEKERVAFG